MFYSVGSNFVICLCKLHDSKAKKNTCQTANNNYFRQVHEKTISEGRLLAFYSYTLRYLIYIKSMMFLYFEKKVLKRAFFKKKNKSENSLHDTGIHGLRYNLED